LKLNSVFPLQALFKKSPYELDTVALPCPRDSEEARSHWFGEIWLLRRELVVARPREIALLVSAPFHHCAKEVCLLLCRGLGTSGLCGKPLIDFIVLPVNIRTLLVRGRVHLTPGSGRSTLLFFFYPLVPRL